MAAGTIEYVRPRILTANAALSTATRNLPLRFSSVLSSLLSLYGEEVFVLLLLLPCCILLLTLPLARDTFCLFPSYLPSTPEAESVAEVVEWTFIKTGKRGTLLSVRC